MGRLFMCVMLALQSSSNHLIRGVLPTLVPLIAAANGYSDAERAMMLGAFFPGYLVTQIPAGAFAQKHGGKLVLAINTLGTAAITLLLPAVAKSGSLSSNVGPRLPTLLLAAMGLFQGSLVPGQVQMQKDWLPTGSARAWTLSCTEMGNACIILGCQFLAPRIAAKYGWEAIPLIFGSYIGCFGVLWSAFAINKPTDALPQPAAPKSSENSRVAVRWHQLFRTGPAQAVVLSQIASNNSNYTLSLWAPTYFTEVLGCTMVEAVGFLAVTAPISMGGGFVLAAVDTLLREKLQLSELAIRRAMVLTQSMGTAAALVLFGMARTPAGATVALCVKEAGTLCYSLGVAVNYLEVGAANTALLKAVGNTMANVPGLLIPIVGVALRKATGAWMPLFCMSASLHLVAGAHFMWRGAVKPAIQ